MAKNIEVKANGATQTKKKKKTGLIVFLIILTIIIGGLVAIIGFNVFNIRDNYLSDLLRGIPIVNNLLPPETTDEGYNALSKEDLIAELEAANIKIENLEANISNVNKKYDDKIKEVDRLKVFEDQQIQFKEQKEEFDRLIALGDPTAYAKFYESINSNSEELYREVVGINALSAEAKKYYQTASGMEPDAAALMLEELMKTDLDITADILMEIPNDQRSAILAEMQPANSATIMKRLYPN